MAACNVMMRPSNALGTARVQLSSQFAFKPVVAARPTRSLALTVEGKRVCDLTGKKANKANAVTFSNKHSRKWQLPNLHKQKIWWENGQRWVTLKVCTKALKTIEKRGIDAMAKEAGIDLNKLPYVDGRKERKEYLAQNPGRVPVAKNPRKMKNPIKLANSKLPKVPVYDESGKILYIAASSVEEAYQKKAEADDALSQGLKITLRE